MQYSKKYFKILILLQKKKKENIDVRLSATRTGSKFG